jgi:hypothetical protein
MPNAKLHIANKFPLHIWNNTKQTGSVVVGFTALLETDELDIWFFDRCCCFSSDTLYRTIERPVSSFFSS